MKQNTYICFMARSKNQRKLFIATAENKVIAVGKSARELSGLMEIVGKSHVWYSRKFSVSDDFLFNFKGIDICFQKVTI